MKLQKSLILRHTYWLFFPLNKARRHLQFISLELMHSLSHHRNERNSGTEIGKTQLTKPTMKPRTSCLNAQNVYFSVYRVVELNYMISKFTSTHEDMSSTVINSVSTLRYYALNFDKMLISRHSRIQFNSCELKGSVNASISVINLIVLWSISQTHASICQ